MPTTDAMIAEIADLIDRVLDGDLEWVDMTDRQRRLIELHLDSTPSADDRAAEDADLRVKTRKEN